MFWYLRYYLNYLKEMRANVNLCSDALRDYESRGRGFESSPARQKIQLSYWLVMPWLRVNSVFALLLPKIWFLLGTEFITIGL